ncbi:hypothetical protein [Veillonella sp. 27098_8_77]|uniref:hypothetical protein n=1 Tax=Veillonella sp. 27098_8_77 TaxID=3003642 RepID=UPI00352DE2D3
MMRKFKYIFDIRVMIGIVAILSFSLYIFSGATLNFYQNPSKEIVVIGNYQFSRYPVVELEDRSKNITLEVSVYAKLLEDKTLYVLGERAVYIIDVESNKMRMIYNEAPLFEQYISNAQLMLLYGNNIETVNTLSDKDKYYIDKLITPNIYSTLSYNSGHKMWLDRVLNLISI